jgi:glycosyltransferase involved in cell wall biosynthesis
MDLLRKRRANIHLTLAGEGPEGEALARLIGTLELADHVSMVGFIPQERLSMYYGASDFFVLSTRTLEGFGLVTLESLACGTPVLGTPVGGTVEILSGLDPTFLFKGVSPEIMAEGIERAVVEYPVGGEEYEALRMRCSQYAARNYSWLRHMDQFQAILEELLEK